MPQLQKNENQVRRIGRKKPVRWTKEEHRLFLHGMAIFGKGHWSKIARYVVITKTQHQVASHAQKYFLHHSSVKQSKKQRKRRPSIHDITLENEVVSQQIHIAEEVISLPSDKLVSLSIDHQHNPIEQLPENLNPQQLLTPFEGNLAALHHNEQQSSWLLPSTMQQQLPHSHSNDSIDLAPLPDLIDLSPLPNLPDLPDLYTQQFPGFIDHHSLVPTPNQQFPNYFDQPILQELQGLSLLDYILPYELKFSPDLPGSSQ